jgi:hypothetical protein
MEWNHLTLGIPIQRGLGVGLIAVVAYLTIVVVTTPSLRPVDAVAVSVVLNWWLIGAVSAGAGVQAYLVSYANERGCSLKHRRAASGASGFLAGLSSFVSFLALIPLGCCGTWVYLVSFLPGFIGAGASGFILANGLQFEVLGLGLMAMSVAFTYMSVRTTLARSRR